jgi:MFS family permease
MLTRVAPGKRRNYYFIIGAVVMMQITSSTIYMVLPLFFASVGTSMAENGLLISVGTFAGILSSLTAGVLSNKYGRKKLLTLSAFIYSSTFFMLEYLGHDFGTLMLSRFIAGIGFYIMPVMATTMAADTFPMGERGRAMSLYQISSGIGSLIGPLIMPLLVFRNDYTLYFLFSGTSILISGFAMAFLVKETLPAEVKARSDASIGKKYDVRGFLGSVKGLGVIIGIFLAAVVLYRTAYTMIDPFLSLYLAEVLKLDLGSISYIYALRAVCYILFSYIAGFLIDKYGKKKVLLTGLGMTVVTTLSYTVTSTFLQMLVLRAWDAAATATLLTGISTLMADLLSPETRGLGMGLYSATSQQSSTIGSLFSGFLIDAYGFNLVFITAGIACALSLVIVGVWVPGSRRNRH